MIGTSSIEMWRRWLQGVVILLGGSRCHPPHSDPLAGHPEIRPTIYSLDPKWRWTAAADDEHLTIDARVSSVRSRPEEVALQVCLILRRISPMLKAESYSPPTRRMPLSLSRQRTSPSKLRSRVPFAPLCPSRGPNWPERPWGSWVRLEKLARVQPTRQPRGWLNGSESLKGALQIGNRSSLTSKALFRTVAGGMIRRPGRSSGSGIRKTISWRPKILLRPRKKGLANLSEGMPFNHSLTRLL